ncbi:nucleoporin-interacting protein [Paenibacillus sp.]|uniref:nucleoporin-interacting protein n=1 Tax=Paenibacillus sp. TaxID=58172 RepID=UPI002D62665D|nr:nucleoporin-interacting protein [Paenibacillus sp.]HZG88093.1 nucleoporin-interacting protein [Paenibacillus sp.]
MKERSFAAAPLLASALFAAALGALRLMYASPYAASWDAVDFALALDRFDLLAMQPHAPGYPFFVLPAMLLRPLFGGDAVAALAAVGALLYASAVVPMYRLAREALPARPAAGVVMLMQAASYPGLSAALPMSEAAAVGALWWYVYAAFAAFRAPRFAVRLLPAALFGLLMGIRLSYVAFALPLLPLWLRELRASRLRAAAFAAVAAAAQLLWLGALAASEGSAAGFVQLSLEFARGHFADWGGAATAEASAPLGERLIRLVGYNLLWVGLCGGSAWNAAALGALAAFAAFAASRRRGRSAAFRRRASADRAAWGWLAAAFAAYFAWALLAQNVDKPRHILPLVGPLLALGGASAMRAASAAGGRVFRAAGAMLLAAAVAAQLWTGFRLLVTLRTETPAVVALHRYAEERLPEPFALYTWEETRVLQYLGASYPHKRAYTFALVDEERRARPDRRIYVTDKVVQGFAAQGVDPKGRFEPVATFASNAIIEPVYYRITLYEWK